MNSSHSSSEPCSKAGKGEPRQKLSKPYLVDQFASAGYAVSSAYTMIKHKDRVSFSYRDNLWRGSDLLATGVASFAACSDIWIPVSEHDAERRVLLVERR